MFEKRKDQELLGNHSSQDEEERMAGDDFARHEDRFTVTVTCVAAGLRCGMWPADSVGCGTVGIG